MGYAGEGSVMLIFLVLPGLFGLTLIGEGTSKVMDYEPKGWIGIIAGLIFIGVVLFAYLYMQNTGM